MGYDVAIAKAWSSLEAVNPPGSVHTVRILTDEYTVDIAGKRVMSVSCNVPAKERLTILGLHYLAKRLTGLPPVSGEWISFRQLDGGEGYYPAFKKRVIDAIVRKYGRKPEALLDAAERLHGKRAQMGDISAVFEVFDNVPILVTLERGDEEFGPGANVLFDTSIKEIYCTEDVVVLSEYFVSQI